MVDLTGPAADAVAGALAAALDQATAPGSASPVVVDPADLTLVVPAAAAVANSDPLRRLIDRGAVRVPGAPSRPGLTDIDAVRAQRDLGVRVACTLAAERDAIVVSTASPAVLAAAARFTAGLLRGVTTAAWAHVSELPTVLLDVAATSRPSTDQLVVHAALGTAFAGAIAVGGLDSGGGSGAPEAPATRVGLLGTRAALPVDPIRADARAALADLLPELGAVFVEHIDATDWPTTAADVVVTDGHTAGVLLDAVGSPSGDATPMMLLGARVLALHLPAEQSDSSMAGLTAGLTRGLTTGARAVRGELMTRTRAALDVVIARRRAVAGMPATVLAGAGGSRT